MDKIKILILAANPWKTKRLVLDEEFQRTQELWESSDFQERFELRYYPALRGEALQEKVLKFKPHLIHFSGHGEEDSLVFADLTGENPYEVSKQALAQLFKLCVPDLKAVFLNACYSANQAEFIVEQVPSVIGMNTAIDDLAAISFSRGFYSAIFSQNELDIEKAFNAGLSQMAIEQIPEKEQRKPVLQKCRQTFVPTFKHDIFVSFADTDKEWATSLTDYLRKKLKLNLNLFDKDFQIYSGNDFNQLDQSALLLIIASPEYCQHYQVPLNSLKPQNKIIFIEKELYNPRPEFLKGYIPTKFWRYDDSSGMQFLIGAEYFVKADELANEVYNSLIELKNKYHYQQQITQKCQQKSESKIELSKSIDAFVFLHSTKDDLQLAQQIEAFLLKKYGIYCAISIEAISPETPANEIRADRTNNMLNCDAILIIYENGSLAWARVPLSDYRTIKSTREKEGKSPLKIIAAHKKQGTNELGIKTDNLKVYDCPPQHLENYLEDFVEALTK